MSTVQPTTTSREPADDSLSVPCVRHPDVETVLRCGKCETPICPKCMVPTPVGMRCRACAQVKRVALVAKPGELLKAGAFGLGAAIVGSIIVLLIRFSPLLLLAVVGYAVGEAVARGARLKRGKELAILAIVCLFLGYILAPWVLALLSGRFLSPAFILVSAGATLSSPMVLLGLGLGSLIAWMRLR